MPLIRSPPICIKHIITNCPKTVNCSAITTVVSPVTHTDVVETNSESIKLIGFLLLIGNLSKIAPIIIIAIIPRTKT